MYEKELFANYEFDSSNWNKVILGLLGGSAIFHVIILLFLVYVPAVRDAFYVAMLFSDAPTGWVSKDYNKTEIGEETVSILNLPPSDQLQYPAGYFNLANGDAPAPDLIASTTPVVPETISTDSNSIPGFPGITFDQQGFTPNSSGIPPEFTNPTPATPIGRRSETNLPSPLKKRKKSKITPFESVNGANGEAPGIPGSGTPGTNEPNKNAAATATPSPTPNTTTGSLNSEPLKVLANKAVKQINNKEIDLNKPVNVTIKGVLDDKGKLIADQTKHQNNGGDEKLASMAVELIAAMNDSNMLTYVKSLCNGNKKCNVLFNISKDEKEVKFQVASTAVNENEARQTMNGLNLLFSFFKEAKKGTEEGDLLEKVVFSTDKNQVLIDWSMDTPTAMRKIQNKLDKIAAEPKPSPTSSTPNSNFQTAGK